MVALSFKKCTINDLDALVNIGRSTFISAFKAKNNPDDFKLYMDTAFSKGAIRNQLLNPNSLFYFLYLKNDLVGYLKLNVKDAQNEQFDKQSIELERIYILQNFQGRQLGKNALLKTIEIAKDKKVDFLWLGVWEHNHAAIRFYKRYGFKKFGSHPYMLGNDKQTDWLMKLDFT